jgi:probable HAF family extracellular repeat protein
VLLCGLVVGLASQRCTVSPAATVIDLGTLDGGVFSAATAINDSGVVTGYSLTKSPSTRGFVWQDGKLTDLGLLPNFAGPVNPTTNSYGYGINSSGQIVGYSDTADSVAHSMRSDAGKLTDLHLALPPSPYLFQHASNINDSGQVVGYAKNTAVFGQPNKAVLFQSGMLTDLGTLPGGTVSYAYAINNAGVIVGQSETKTSARAFVYQNNKMTDLGTLGGAMSYAAAINETGLIAGMAQTAGGALHAALWQEGTPLDLGVLGAGNSSDAHGINDAGFVVGRSSIDSKGTSRAFLWRNGIMTDLNSLLPDDSPWTLQYAAAINNKNQVVGYGLIEGQTRAFLMNVPEPSTSALAGMGIFGLLAAAWRGRRSAPRRSAWPRSGWRLRRTSHRSTMRRSRLRQFAFMVRVAVPAALLLAACLLCADAVRAEPGGTARSFITSIEDLELSRQRYLAGDTFLGQVVARNAGAGDTYYGWGPYSVVPKSNIPAANIPPGFDMHNFLSFGDYWWPNPNTADGTPWVLRDGFSNPANQGDMKPFTDLSNSVYLNSLGYYFTGNEKYAQQAATQLRTFFLDPDTRMYPSQYYALLIPGVSAGTADVPGMRNNMRMVYDAAGILEKSAAWSAADKAGFQDWTRGYLDFLFTSSQGAAQFKDPANHGSSFYELTALMNLYVGDDAKARQQLLRYMLELFPNQVNAFGTQVLEIQRADNLLYSTYHFGIMSDIANLMSNNFSDLDLWNYTAPNGASLRQALNFLLPFWTGEQEWPYNAGFKFPPQDQLFYFRQMLTAAAAWDDADLYKLAMVHQSEVYNRDPIYLTAPFGDLNALVVPEPATNALLAIGLGCLAVIARRSRRRRVPVNATKSQ